MRIAIDLDGTCMDFMGHWRAAYREQFPHRQLREPSNGYHALAAETHFENEQQWWEWHEEEVGWEDVPWIKGARKNIDRLIREGHQVEFVTARPSYGWEATRRQLFYYFGDQKLTFSSQYSSKASCIERTILSSFWPDLWIEDSPHELQSLNDYRMRWEVVVFDQPWNQLLEADYRMTKWKQIQHIVRSIEHG